MSSPRWDFLLQAGRQSSVSIITDCWGARPSNKNEESFEIRRPTYRLEVDAHAW